MSKQLLCLVLSVSIGAVACSKKESPTGPSDVVPPAQATCIYSVSTTTFNIAGSGGSATLTVNTGTTCTWTATTSSSFISITGTGGSGPGNVSFNIAENSGDARVGTLTVAGQAVIVNQAAGDPVYGNWGGTIVKGSGCPASLPASVEYTGSIRRTGGATNEFAIAIPALGLPSQTLALTITGNNLQFFVPIDTLYTFNGTLASDRRSLTGTFSGGTCSGTWNGTRR